MRTIVIEVMDSDNFTVKEGDRYCDKLIWDEMLGTIAELTHPKIGTARYRMLTQAEWNAACVTLNPQEGENENA